MVVDYERRERDTVTRFRGKLTHHEVLGQIIFQPVEASNRLQD
jgi:hypothetical protein